MTDAPTEREGEGAWAKLRRRKVVQWGIAYAAGAWGLLQGLGYLSSTFDWPRQIQQLTTIALFLGLPIALVLAWYHGDRGEHHVGRTELAILTVLFLLGGGLFWRYEHASHPSPDASAVTAAPAPAAATTEAGPSIAVLPFENRSAKQDDIFFVDGIHDDILTQLSKISALKVISRTSVERFRNTQLPIKEIAQLLGVKSILEGGVQRGGDRVRINVQLIDAGTDAHLWAETYDRELTAANIFAIQSELATAIAAALKGTLTPDETLRIASVPTRNLEAWEAYQIGQQRMAKRTGAGVLGAKEFFRKAIKLDPTFAQAHAALAQALTLEISYNGRATQEVIPDAERSADRALELDPTLAEAWSAKGLMASMQSREADAQRQLRKAIELNPGYAPAYHWLSRSLQSAGQLADSQAMAERAVQLDPMSPVVNEHLGVILEARGRFTEAARRYRGTIEIDPANPLPYGDLATLQAYAMNRFAEAAPLLAKAAVFDPEGPSYPAQLALLFLDLDDVARAKTVLADAWRHWPDDAGDLPFSSAEIHATLGNEAPAERDARRVLQQSPREPLMHLILRNVATSKGDYQKARSRYAGAFPELLGSDPPHVTSDNFAAAIDLVPVLRNTGEGERAQQLLDGSEQVMRELPRLGRFGFGISDVALHALRGDKAKAMAALRDAERDGWRGPFWRYFRDVEPNIASIRNEPEFKAVFTDIERDMARQRAELAARPKDAPLDLGESAK